MTTKWLGRLKCELCGADLTKDPWFVDGKTSAGPWALMCPPCFYINGVGLGLGKGQKYDGDSLEKIDG